MAKTAEKTDPALWQKVKQDITKGAKGGRPGQWSARKAQLAVSEYKEAGGKYKGPKSPDNHLLKWQREEWGTRSGHRSLGTGERYLPKQARAGLTPEEYRRTTEKKRADTRRGKQFSAQPKDIADKTAAARKAGSARKVQGPAGKGPASKGKTAGRAAPTRKALLDDAARRGIAGRSRMTKDQLRQALGRPH